MLWGLGVGYVISGMYFGWNLGLAEGGPFGMLGATLLVTVMYGTFVLGYSELACAMPQAGGAFVYATRAFGPFLGTLAGLAQWMEFVFAPPAIALAIGAYFALFPGAPSAESSACWAYVLFTALNVWGVRQSAWFELLVTVLAVLELLVFAAFTLPHFHWEAFQRDAFPLGYTGIFSAIPFAIWFYLAIEGLANVAEEAHEPSTNLSRAFFLSLGTLVILALLVLFASVGVHGWRAIVFPDNTGVASDSPLPLALGHVVGRHHPLYHMLVSMGLLGLVASFHGILLAAGRVTFEFGRSGHFPAFIGRVLPERGTPAAALVLNLALGIGSVLSGRTADLILLSVFGAIALYILSMLALFALRQREPGLFRPFRTPFFPWVPATALGLSLVCLGSLVAAHPRLTGTAALLLVSTSLVLARRQGRPASENTQPP
jgi:ethanolamine permease